MKLLAALTILVLVFSVTVVVVDVAEAEAGRSMWKRPVPRVDRYPKTVERQQRWAPSNARGRWSLVPNGVNIPEKTCCDWMYGREYA